MHKTALLILACLALLSTNCFAQEANCDALTCDECPVYRDANGFVYVNQSKDCSIVDGKSVLTCNCDDPPEGALPAARGATPADDNTGDVNDLPPDGGGGTRIPTQSYGETSSAGHTSPMLLLATFAAIAAAMV
jgi:hypothetical protein